MTTTETSHTEATKKSAYTAKEEARLEEIKSKLGAVKAKIKGAVADGQIELSEELRKAEIRADSHLATVENHLSRLRDASEESWEDLTSGLENAWDDLAQSIKKVVARFD